MKDGDRGEEEMIRERVIKDDGRYLIFYHFGPDGRKKEQCPEDARPPVKRKDGDPAHV